MCLLKLSSTNPKFSYVIRKNPSSGVLIKDVRKGKAYGFYRKGSEQEYVIYFKDASNTISYKEYKEQEFEYLNRLRYMSPIFVLNAISEMLHSAVKTIHEHDCSEFENELFVNVVDINGHGFNVVNKFISYFPNTVFVESKTYNGYQVNIRTKRPIYYLLNFAVVLFMTISCLGENDMTLDEGMILKLVGSLNVIDAPYYIRYLISSRMLYKYKFFESCLSQLQGANMKMNFGTTAHHRREFIKKQLYFDRQIIDIGCGSGFYAVPFSKSLKNKDDLYYAVDNDEEELNKLERRIKVDNLENIRLFSSVDELIGVLDIKYKYDIIVTEVIEHMTMEESKGLIKTVMDKLNFRLMIVTTPNHDFNKYYQNIEFRHEGHLFELTGEEFSEYIKDITKGRKDVSVNIVDIGDVVDGLACTQGAIFKKV